MRKDGVFYTDTPSNFQLATMGVGSAVLRLTTNDQLACNTESATYNGSSGSPASRGLSLASKSPEPGMPLNAKRSSERTA